MPVIEYLNASFIYSFLKDAWGFISVRKSRKARADLKSREKWKGKTQEYLYDIRAKNLRDDVIIRDIDRYNQYPDALDQKGISPWFKLGILELYHNGVKFGLRVSSLIFEDSEQCWRKASDEEQAMAIRAYLVGYIPFRNIVSIDFDGDEYYSFPHFTCKFSESGMPYEFLKYCEKKEFSGGDIIFPS